MHNQTAANRNAAGRSELRLAYREAAPESLAYDVKIGHAVLRKNLAHNAAVNIGQALFAASKTVDEFFVVEAQ